MNPFLNALQKNLSKPRPKKDTNADPAPRVLMLNHADMPTLKKRRPGDRVTAHVRGVIHSVDKDGNVAVHIQDAVDPQVGFGDENDGPPKPTMK